MGNKSEFFFRALLLFGLAEGRDLEFQSVSAGLELRALFGEFGNAAFVCVDGALLFRRPVCEIENLLFQCGDGNFVRVPFGFEGSQAFTGVVPLRFGGFPVTGEFRETDPAVIRLFGEFGDL